MAWQDAAGKLRNLIAEYEDYKGLLDMVNGLADVEKTLRDLQTQQNDLNTKLSELQALYAKKVLEYEGSFKAEMDRIDANVASLRTQKAVMEAEFATTKETHARMVGVLNEEHRGAVSAFETFKKDSITERKRLEAELRVAQQKLADAKRAHETFLASVVRR